MEVLLIENQNIANKAAFYWRTSWRGANWPLILNGVWNKRDEKIIIYQPLKVPLKREEPHMQSHVKWGLNISSNLMFKTYYLQKKSTYAWKLSINNIFETALPFGTNVWVSMIFFF